MKGNQLTLIAILASGTAATVVVKPSALIPAAVVGAIFVAIIIWTLSRGGRLALGRSRTGYVSFKLYGAKARQQSTRRRPTASPTQNMGPSSEGVPEGGTSGSAGKAVSGVAIVLLAFGGGTWALVANAHSPGVKPSPHVAQTSPSASASPLAPAAVVRSYFTAINRRDWKRIWQLWHGKLQPGQRPPYESIAAGFRLTKRDVVTSIRTHGDRVSVRVLAYETTGAVQTYAFGYVVHRGHITHGWGRLLSTRLG